MYSAIFQFFSITISSISLLSIFGSNLDLGYLAESLISNYELVRNFIWQPIELVVSIGDSDKNICTFLGVFIPAFLCRGNEVSRIAAVSLFGSFVMLLALILIMSSILFINEITGLFEIITTIWKYITEVLLLLVILSIILLLVAIYLFLLGFAFSLNIYYWLIFFLLPHLPIFILNSILLIDLNAKGESKSILLASYIVGYKILILGNYIELIEPERAMKQSLRWMSWKETKVYYSPIKEVGVLAIAILVVSKVVFDTAL